MVSFNTESGWHGLARNGFAAENQLLVLGWRLGASFGSRVHGYEPVSFSGFEKTSRASGEEYFTSRQRRIFHTLLGKQKLYNQVILAPTQPGQRVARSRRRLDALFISGANFSPFHAFFLRRHRGVAGKPGLGQRSAPHQRSAPPS